jgi:hypothetical protein
VHVNAHVTHRTKDLDGLSPSHEERKQSKNVTSRRQDLTAECAVERLA